jgi:uroporphyrinogen decarboxylase
VKSMNKRERVEAALNGAEVDRIPIGFWQHYSLQEWARRRLAQLNLDSHRRLDTDFEAGTSKLPYCLTRQ